MPGILICRQADWDGWPVGMITRVIGPFENREACFAWEKAHDWLPGEHTDWQELTAPW